MWRCALSALSRRDDLLWATLGEAGLISVITAVALAAREPLIFASLGPTAYELVEQPHQRSARTYNILVGHMIGLGTGFLALFLLGGWSEPNALSTAIVTQRRFWIIVIAVTATTFLTLIARPGQPAALATTLLVALGSMQKGRDAVAMVIGVLLIAAIGEPLRRIRLKQAEATVAHLH